MSPSQASAKTTQVLELRLPCYTCTLSERLEADRLEDLQLISLGLAVTKEEGLLA